jgi:hypothetical protein
VNWALFTKDLLATWKLAATLAISNAAASLWAVGTGGTESPHLSTVAGMLTTSLALGGVMVPGILIGYERERRHWILLQSLPVTSGRIVWVKASAALAASLAASFAGCIPWLRTGQLHPGVPLLMFSVLLVVSSAAVLVSVLTRQPLAFLAMCILGFGIIGAAGFAVYGIGLDPLLLAVGTVLPAAGAAALMLETAAQTMARRELDL